MQCDRKAIFEYKERANIERKGHTGQGSSSLQKYFLFSSIHVDEDVRAALGIGALNLLRVGGPVLESFPTIGL